MATIGSLVYDIRASDSQLEGDLAKAEGKIKSFGSGVGEILKLAGEAIVAAGLAATGFAVDMVQKYDAATVAMQNNANLSAGAAGQIANAFIGTAGSTSFSAQTMMDAYAGVVGQLQSTAGHAYSTADALTFMRAATDLAEASGQDLKVTTAALSSVMQTFQLPVSQASYASDILLNSSRASGKSMDEWTQAITRAGAMAGAARPGIQDLSTFMLDLQNHGESGRAAMGLLGSTLNGLMTPTQAVIDEQKKLGVSFIDNHGQLMSIQDILAQVSPKIQGMGDAQATATLKAMGFGAASDKLVSTIRGGTADWDKYAGQVTQTGTAAQGAENYAHSLQGRLETLKSEVVDDAIKFGQWLQPAIAGVVGWLADNLPKAISNATQWWNQHQQQIISVAGTIASFVSGVAQNLIHVLSQIWQWFSDNRGAILGVAAVVGGAVLFAFQGLVTVIGFLSDHLDILMPIIILATVAFVAFKTAMLIQDIIQGVSMALFMFQAGLEGATVAEVGAETAAYSFGAAMDVMMGPVGIAVLAVTALVTVLLGVAGGVDSAQKATDDWNNKVAQWKDEQVKALAEIGKAWQQLQSKTVSADDVLKTLFNDQVMQMGQLAAGIHDLTDVNTIATKQWITTLDQANLRIVSLLATLPNGTTLVQQFHDEMGKTGGDSSKALDNMAASGQATAKEIRDVKLAMDELRTNTDLEAALSAYDALVNQQGATAQSALLQLQKLNPTYALLIQQNNSLAGATGIAANSLTSMGTINFAGLQGTSSQLITQIQNLAKQTGLTYDQVVNLATEGGNHLVQLSNGAVVNLTGHLDTWQTSIDAAHTKIGGFGTALLGLPLTRQFTLIATVQTDAVLQKLMSGNIASFFGFGHAAGGRFDTPHIAAIAEGETEWVVNKTQAGAFAPLLDALVGIGSSLTSPALNAPISQPVTMGGGTSIINQPSTVSVSLNMNGVMTRSRAELRGVAMDMLDAVNEELKSKGMTQLPTRQVPL